ncbi:hypothetical protein BV25DRAFT_1542707 [Artomyces pyxidatus]|uniref:Uncharacterized protein n=1 Tax=Artomyces pyxidatus TaxID=48021 RepID=A0ACB8SK17_9AGAM|nr:hypothetical protein BV25DRAFT_1542707 [Artomyces pyxidatus]
MTVSWPGRCTANRAARHHRAGAEGAGPCNPTAPVRRRCRGKNEKINSTASQRPEKKGGKGCRSSEEASASPRTGARGGLPRLRGRLYFWRRDPGDARTSAATALDFENKYRPCVAAECMLQWPLALEVRGRSVRPDVKAPYLRDAASDPPACMRQRRKTTPSQQAANESVCAVVKAGAMNNPSAEKCVKMYAGTAQTCDTERPSGPFHVARRAARADGGLSARTCPVVSTSEGALSDGEMLWKGFAVRASCIPSSVLRRVRTTDAHHRAMPMVSMKN